MFFDGMFNEAQIAEALVASPARYLRSRDFLRSRGAINPAPVGVDEGLKWAPDPTGDLVAVVFPTPSLPKP